MLSVLIATVFATLPPMPDALPDALPDIAVMEQAEPVVIEEPVVVVEPVDTIEEFPTRIIVGWRKQCINGVCTSVPIYADVPPATPGHTHEELGGAVCRVCGRSCFMLRSAEAAAAAKGETSNEAIQAEYTRLYGSGGSSYSRSRIGLFGRWRR